MTDYHHANQEKIEDLERQVSQACSLCITLLCFGPLMLLLCRIVSINWKFSGVSNPSIIKAQIN